MHGALCFHHIDQKAADLMLCPRQFLVLDVTPCDTIYKSMPLQDKNFTKVAEKAIKRLKKSVRSVFQNMWTRPIGLDQGPASILPAAPRQCLYATPSWALTIHGTDKAREALKLRGFLSEHYNLTEGMYSKPSAASNDAFISSSAVSVAAADARAEAVAMGAVVKAAARAEGVLMVAAARAAVGDTRMNMPWSWCTALGQQSPVDAISEPSSLASRNFTFL